jgi:hypothetical protein
VRRIFLERDSSTNFLMNSQNGQATRDLLHHTVSPQMVKAYFCGSDLEPRFVLTTLVLDKKANFPLTALILLLQEQIFMVSSPIIIMYFSAEALSGAYVDF